MIRDNASAFAVIQEFQVTPRRPLFVMGLVLVVYIALGIGYALRTAAWQAPDEPAHYNYVAQIAASGCCPVIAEGDWDQEYLSALTTARFAPELLDRFETIQYEDHQPPLYYLLGAPVFSLTSGSLTALRLFSVMLGVWVIVFTFAIGLQVAPQRPWVAVAAGAFVAFLPQHTAILASVNNDALAEVVIAAGLYTLIRRIRQPDSVPVWVLGMIAGIGALTKASALFLFGLIPIMLILSALLERRPFRLLARDVALFLGISLAIASLWWVRNLSVYGAPDFLGLGAHDAVVIGQLRTADRIAEWGWEAYLRTSFETTVNSFFGQFGWMALPMPLWMVQLFAVMAAAGLIGALLGLLMRLGGGAQTRLRLSWLALLLALGFGVLQFIYYNTTFVQPQGRYLFAALVPLALLLAWGWDVWARLIAPRLAAADLLPVLPVAIALILLPLNVWILWRFIPLLAP